MSLEALAAFAVANNNTASRPKPLSALSLEEARAKVKIADGNRKKAGDGSVALILKLGKKNIALDAISAGATRVNATADQIQQFTTVLQAAINDGSFDDEITRLQLESVATESVEAVPEQVSPTPTAEQAQTSVPDGVDLNELG
tara:strand:+ start:3755 stop:4186 length:432 start_codon:yes stop_codon:yes gene_type:complete